MEFDIFSWVIIPILIFCARVVDVSLGTLRFIFIARGNRKWAPLLGFVEVLVWVLAVREVLVNLRNIVCFLAYGGGFAMGSYVGMWLEEKLSIGMLMVRVVLKNSHESLVSYLNERGYGFTLVDGEGNGRKVKILFSIVKRGNLTDFLQGLSTIAPGSFYTLENIKSANQGIFPMSENTVFEKLFRKHRKSK